MMKVLMAWIRKSSGLADVDIILSKAAGRHRFSITQASHATSSPTFHAA
jgi:hypothetical protein